MLRREVGPGTVSLAALYVVLKLASRGQRIIYEERLVKLLFFLFYAEVSGEEVRLRDTPPRLSPEVGFRIYLRGPYIRIKRLLKLVNELATKLYGAQLTVVREIPCTPNAKCVEVTVKALEEAENLLEAVRSRLVSRLGSEEVERMDKLLELLAGLPQQELTMLALRLLGLEDRDPAIRKAMAINMDLDDYLEILKTMKKIHKDYRVGRLAEDKDIGNLDELLEEED